MKHSAEQIQIALDRRIGLRGRFVDFVRLVWPIVANTPYVHSWHLDVICDALERVTSGETPYLIVNQPPATGKSIIVSKIWPVWNNLRIPRDAIFSASYLESLALRDAGAQEGSLKLIKSKWFQARWGDILKPLKTSPADGDYYYTSGGRRACTSCPGGGITGFHPNKVIVDDPLDVRRADGKALENIGSWWRETLPSRTPSIVLVMQRLHELDPTGLALSEKERPWVHIRLPMLWEAPGAPYDPRTEEGQLLCPDVPKASESDVRARKEVLGSRAFSAQYQQRPAPAGGAIYRREWFRYWIPACAQVPVLPGEHPHLALPDRFDQLVISVDCTFKDSETSDYVCIQVWGKKSPSFYLLDQHWERMGLVGTLQAIRAMRRKWPKAFTVLVEDKANGSAVIEILRKEIPGILPIEPEGGKGARAQATAPVYEAGNVLHPHPSAYPWVDGLHDELATFPFSANDDRVDAGSQALLWFLAKSSNLAAAMAALQKQGGSLLG